MGSYPSHFIRIQDLPQVHHLHPLSFYPLITLCTLIPTQFIFLPMTLPFAIFFAYRSSRRANNNIDCGCRVASVSLDSDCEYISSWKHLSLLFTSHLVYHGVFTRLKTTVFRQKQVSWSTFSSHIIFVYLLRSAQCELPSQFRIKRFSSVEWRNGWTIYLFHFDDTE